jgi:adenosylcobinamide-GDP ribazoletransferase
MSQKDKGKILEIMKRGNIGPSALFFGVIYLAAKVYLCRRIELVDAAAVFVVARLGMGMACAAGSPAREDGIGRMVLRAPLRRYAFSLLYLAALPWIMAAPLSRLAAGTAIVLAADYLMVLFITRRIGGLTGDTLGFINEVNELVVLLVLTHGYA